MSFPVRLLLYFDVNKTITARDSTKGKSFSKVLSKAVAEVTSWKWSENHPEMTYTEYVDSVLYPGDRSDPKIRVARNKILKNFVNNIDNTSYPHSNEVRDMHQKMVNCVEKSYLFPSFYRCIQKLKENQIPFTIILRSFGENIQDVVSDIKKRFPEETFGVFGYFEKGVLHLPSDNKKQVIKLERDEEIYSLFSQATSHLAIQDNEQEWLADGERSRSGKKFFFHPEDRELVSLFVDNKVKGDSNSNRDIVCPIIPGKGMVRTYDWLGKTVFKARTAHAILDENYFIKIVNIALEAMGHKKIS